MSGAHVRGHDRTLSACHDDHIGVPADTACGESLRARWYLGAGGPGAQPTAALTPVVTKRWR